ncbi:murein L,D-transpeptidase catalytic domain family protein [Nafulsella turpanensis]|uniref:murein L,D-transpeptidase catalytic domain family protein n=1 Tax=Nafulsella turpanensis TaxID=1265690 RepID=UPI00034B4077|nr:murein L,D-transpeptidase catalytic domain family protein [Nafulsella turpanensis]
MKETLLTLSIVLFSFFSFASPIMPGKSDPESIKTSSKARSTAYFLNTPASEKEATVKTIFSDALKRQMAEEAFLNLYSQFDWGTAARPDFQVFRKGLIGFLNIQKANSLSEKNILTLIDFSLPSSQKRLWIIDLDQKELLFHELVAHGRNSGTLFAESFSNVRNSNTSSLGFYLTGEKYHGKYGLSLRLDGLEEGYNDNARERAIVLHGADYASEAFVEAQGRLGRSFGCPAVPFENKDAIVEAIDARTVLFIYAPDQKYNEDSQLLRTDAAVNYFAESGFELAASR